MRVKIRDQSVTIHLRKLRANWGEADSCLNGEIWLDRRMESGLALEVVCHEVLHKALPDLSEPAVDETAEALGAVLKKLGFGPLTGPFAE